MNRYTEVTRESWLSRLGNSFKNTFGGIILFLGAIVLLWWNEGRAVKTAKGLEEGSEQVLVLDEPVFDEKNNDKLIHLQGLINTQETLVDHQFNINVQAIKLKRTVEMYQWKETSKTSTQKKVGGGKETTKEYSYEKTWSSKLINSNQFEYRQGHENPNSLPYDNIALFATNLFLGDFSMTEDIIAQIDNYEGIKLTEKNVPADGGVIIQESENDQTLSKMFLGSGSTSTPQIGDVKVSFYQIPCGEYSIIAQQNNKSLKPFKTSTETTILIVSPGDVSAKEMFENAIRSNTVLTWALRFVGFGIMFFGLLTMASLLTTIADVVPLFGSIVNLGMKVFAGVVSFLTAMLVIGIAWIYYRPLLGGILIAVGIVTSLFFYKKSLDSKSI
ncbi:TMEM43 family protein [Parvicella tangerina]|uniref:Uncharacterized protein n=1 Tax=Parvicella tangerina TaxID=2829795 RepID=A0A916JPD8_9FLAO|nr:TMEM43 family protein [Parvicella tangerina]CAG5084775.1 hypothetical protein CRYO30217_02563 [Parvicella tangerina]